MARVLHPPVILNLMQTQLALIPREATGSRQGAFRRIDEDSRRTGRLGLEQARQALRDAVRRTAA